MCPLLYLSYLATRIYCILQAHWIHYGNDFVKIPHQYTSPLYLSIVCYSVCKYLKENSNIFGLQKLKRKTYIWLKITLWKISFRFVYNMSQTFAFPWELHPLKLNINYIYIKTICNQNSRQRVYHELYYILYV